jgi:serine/threonine protein kinase
MFLIYKPMLLSILDDHILKRPLNEYDCEIVCRQLIGGVAWIHQNEVIHRDIKPSNMGLQSLHPPVAMIFDFGHSTTDTSSLDHYKGTISYLAPEVLKIKYLRSKIPYTKCVDNWSLGICICELVFRKHWPSDAVLVRNSHSNKPEGFSLGPWKEFRGLLDGREGPLVEVTKKMLVVEPVKRITSSEAADYLNKRPATNPSISEY